jgi:hypothetical protein
MFELLNLIQTNSLGKIEMFLYTWADIGQAQIQLGWQPIGEQGTRARTWPSGGSGGQI